MIRAIVRSSLRFRLLVVALAAGVMVAGVVQLRDAPVDVLPEFTPPYAEIQTEALGLSADEVEQLITVPLEADLLNGVEGVEVIRSESLPGLSSIVLVFEHGTDIYRARQLVEERLTQAHALPNVSEAPTLLQPLSSSSRVVMIGLSSDALSPIEQSRDRALDDAAAADGRARRRERGDLGPARPAAPGPGRPGAAPRPQRHPEPGHQDGRQRAGRLAAELPRGLDARNGRLHRDAAAAAAGPATYSTRSPTRGSWARFQSRARPPGCGCPTCRRSGSDTSR